MSVVRIQVDEVRDVRVVSLPVGTKLVITSHISNSKRDWNKEDEITWQRYKVWDDEEGVYCYTMIGARARKDEEQNE